MKKFAFRDVSPTGHERMDMRIPMEQLPKRLDGRNHAGHDIRQVQHAPDFGLDAIPSAGGKFVQELAIETCVNSQTFGDGKNHLSVRNGKTNICGDVDACHQRAFLVAGWAGASLLAGEGDEHFMFINGARLATTVVDLPVHIGGDLLDSR